MASVAHDFLEIIKKVSCWAQNSISVAKVKRSIILPNKSDVRFSFNVIALYSLVQIDDKFFKNWSPLIQATASKSNIKDFTIFGEVFDYSTFNLMTYVRQNKIQTVLDFPGKCVYIGQTTGEEYVDKKSATLSKLYSTCAKRMQSHFNALVNGNSDETKYKFFKEEYGYGKDVLNGQETSAWWA